MVTLCNAAVLVRWAALGLTLLALSGCSNGGREAVVHVLQGATMGTSYSVKLVGPANLDLDPLQARLQGILDRIEGRMSTYRDDSELSRFNREASGQWQAVSEETGRVVALGIEISELSQGAFDMTVGPLVNLWGFGPGAAISKAPSQEIIDRTREEIGYRNIEVREAPPALRKHNNAYLDLSAIAKGYAVDQLAEALATETDAFLVEVGGELRAQGTKPGGEAWKIAIESPRSETRAVQRIIRVQDTAIATSGDYRNYFEENGVRYSHTIDPTSGRPIAHKLASVTVLDSSCARADALATALMVLGDERGRALAERMELAAFFIIKGDEGFVEYATPQFDPYLIQ
ncbi:FAD:protein FMN transferase [Motiliproteus sp. SC1-56]|uniref:FAD:protein FMN transferase n=1 Tax=Motiliproteus sp. SC1-56 TaxID=2799565 RepID=UPI001A8E58DC|nr:FAD:protein FMN transferase [Motiliproteus sp. SC1-56]